MERNRRGKKTRPIGAHSANLTVNVPKWLHGALKKLADKNGLTLGDYLRPVLVKVAQEMMRIQRETIIERFIQSPEDVAKRLKELQRPKPPNSSDLSEADKMTREADGDFEKGEAR